MSGTLDRASAYSYKVILLGERGVGKTTLFKALRSMETEVEPEKDICTEHTASGGFIRSERSRSMISTLESQIDTCTKAVEIGGGQIARLQFCDTAGHTKVHSLMPQYYRNARLILLVYCCHDNKTLQSLSTWIETANSYMDKADNCKNYSFCLVGLRSKHGLELHPPLTYDDIEVTPDSLSNFRSHYYISESLIFEVNLDTKEGLSKLLVTLGRATKKLESICPGVKELCSFTLSDTFDTFQTAPTAESESVSCPKKRSASLKRPDAHGDGCCSVM